MNRSLRLAVLTLAPVALFAAAPATGVTGTAHDLSATGPNTVTASNQVCVFCHAPHGGALVANQVIPLWNRTTTASVFTMYNKSNDPLSNIKGTVDATPSGVSMACLSCHDGTIAVGTVLMAPNTGGNTTYTTAKGGVSPSTGKIASGANILGTDLSNDHPISITYQDDLNSFLNTATSLSGVKLFPSNATGSKVQCSSCHDVHNWGVSGTTAPFLRVTMAGSALCKTCHRN